MTAARILQHTVQHAVEAVAGGDGGFRRQVQFARRNRTSSFLLHRNLRPHFGGNEAVPVDRGRTSENSVIASRKTLGLYQSLPATRRAAIPVSVFLLFTV